MNAILALEDGRIFEGTSFGAIGTQTGEVCFNTSMTGYQEIITDPSYCGQIVTMTYPHIGNYGINPEDSESSAPYLRGLVVHELCHYPSNFRSTISLSDYLKEQGVMGIHDVDTRAITKHLRSCGAMRACLSTELNAEEAIKCAQESAGMSGADHVQEVSCRNITTWDGESREWHIPNVCADQPGYYYELPPISHRIVAYDFGIKHHILRSLRQAGLEVTLVPARTKAADVLAMKPDAVFLSNGPGDPSALRDISDEIAQLIGKLPIMGICLGHQLIAQALGAKTFKLKFGHRGGNHPVKDLRSGKVLITSQNHGFAIDPTSLPDCLEVTHINLNDKTVEGIRHREHPVFSVQYHPEASPGPHEAQIHFKDFLQLIKDQQKQ